MDDILSNGSPCHDCKIDDRDRNILRNPNSVNIFTCVALAKAGLVVGPLRLSVHLSVCPFVCPSVSLSATLMGCLVCVICNSNSFHSFIFKLCLMIVHTLKMCTSYFVHI